MLVMASLWSEFETGILHVESVWTVLTELRMTSAVDVVRSAPQIHDRQKIVWRPVYSEEKNAMRILLIEDDKHVAAFVRKGLREAGHNVIHADCAQGGQDRAGNGPMMLSSWTGFCRIPVMELIF